MGTACLFFPQGQKKLVFNRLAASRSFFRATVSSTLIGAPSPGAWPTSTLTTLAPSAAGVRLLGPHKGPEVNDGFVRSRGSEGWCMANQTLIIIGQGQGSRVLHGFLGNHSINWAIKEMPEKQARQVPIYYSSE